MLVPNRHASSNSYRYGFQGQEKDDEIKGEGNSLDFGARMLDPRVGRWFAHDKVNKPWLSPYQFGDNNPTNNIDSDGNDEIHFYYYTIQKLDKDGKSSTELILSSEIIKNNKEHTFYMHCPFGETVQFHPFKSDKTPNDGSEVAYDNELPLSKGVSFLGFFEKGVDDHAYLGTLLQVAPEILEHYSGSKDGTGVRFQGAVNRSGSVDFAETVIRGTETVYAIIDGYYLVKGLSKFAIKELAKNSAKIGTRNVDNIINSKKPYSTSRPSYGKNQVDEVWESAKQKDGKVYDPNTGEELIWNKKGKRTWDMGHKPGKEYKKLHQDYMDGKITKDEFLKEYQNPKNYQPEAPSANRSRKYENQ